MNKFTGRFIEKTKESAGKRKYDRNIPVIFVLLLAMAMALCSCTGTGTGAAGANTDEPEDVRANNIDRDNPTRFAFYEDGGALAYYLDFAYDGMGRQKTVTAYDAGGNQTDRVECLDESGNLLAELGGGMTEVYDSGSLYVSKSYEYDSRGNCIREYDSYGSYYEYEYDDRGNRTKRSDYSSEGVLDRYTLYTYDDRGNKTGEEDYENDDPYYGMDFSGESGPATFSMTEGDYTSYTYDGAGRIIREDYSYCYYDANGEKRMVSYRLYERDSLGREVSSRRYNADDVLTEYTEREYDEAGHLTLRATYNADETVTFRDETVYDEAGNRIRESYFRGPRIPERDDGTHWEREWDSHGNVLKWTDYLGSSDRIANERSYTIERLGNAAIRTNHYIRSEVGKDENRNPVITDTKQGTSVDCLLLDGQGRKLQAADLDKDGDIRSGQVYEYGSVSGTPARYFNPDEELEEVVEQYRKQGQ